MNQLVVEYWWVPVLTVPALAVVIKLMAENAGLVDSLPGALRKKLSAFEHSYPGHWVVTATLRDGRRFSRVIISDRFRLASDAAIPFKLREIEDIAWEGLVGAPVSPVVQLSEGRPGAG